MSYQDLTPQIKRADRALEPWTEDCAQCAAALVRELAQQDDASHLSIEEAVEVKRERLMKSLAREQDAIGHALRALLNVYCDLIQQGWHLEVESERIIGWPPEQQTGVQNDTRVVKQQKLTVRRAEQLREPPAREFVQKLERGHIFNGARKSIFSLMRDGRNLADELSKCSSPDTLKNAVKPYVQFCDGNSTCEYTGFKLQDIWRYFRHTWSSPYESIPGRTVSAIVRDKAVPDHPVIGIFAISSAAAAIGVRDRFIGWDAETFLNKVKADPSEEYARWLCDKIDGLVGGVYKADLIAEGILPAAMPDIISDDTLIALRRDAEIQRELHYRSSSGHRHGPKKLDGYASDDSWAEKTLEPLFRAKRSKELARLLPVRNTIYDCLRTKPDVEGVQSLLQSRAGLQALRVVVQSMKSISVGTELADLTICGAVAPYNELIGGKLVAALAVGPSVIREYHRRYSGIASVIASSMAGKRVERPNNLVFIGTTSLYGLRPNQYDRVSLPIIESGTKGRRKIKFKYLNRTEEAVGTFHFSKKTKESVEFFARKQTNQWKANNVFGEGTSPKLRSLRDGLAILGLPADRLLQHGMNKAVYGVSLIENLNRYLLGFDRTPEYRYQLDEPAWFEEKIFEEWAARWASKRMNDVDALSRIRKQTLVRPVKHAARVVLPDIDSDQYKFSVE